MWFSMKTFTTVRGSNPLASFSQCYYQCILGCFNSQFYSRSNVADVTVGIYGLFLWSYIPSFATRFMKAWVEILNMQELRKGRRRLFLWWGEKHEKCQSVYSAVWLIPATHKCDVDMQNRAGATCFEFYEFIFIIMTYLWSYLCFTFPHNLLENVATETEEGRVEAQVVNHRLPTAAGRVRFRVRLFRTYDGKVALGRDFF